MLTSMSSMNCTCSSCWRPCSSEIGSTVETEQHGFIIDHEGARAVSRGGLDNERKTMLQ